MRIALAQLNPLVGDLAGNVLAIDEAYGAAVARGARLVAAGELAVEGYPPEDLVLRSAFTAASRDLLDQLARRTGDVPLVVGFVECLPERAQDARSWRAVASTATQYPPLANSAAVLREGRVEAIYRKQRLPNYGVFDEARYFRAGSDPVVVEVDGVAVGVTICEDLWGEGGPLPQSAAAGAHLILNLNASPYICGKRAGREGWARRHAAETGAWVAYVNLVGGQDEVVFDGDSFVIGPDGDVIARGDQFREDLVVVDVPLGGDASPPGALAERLDPLLEIWSALVLATRDYARKNAFASALVGLSGGIDSAVVAAIAADALGPERVHGVGMPSPYSSEGSLSDARALAENLGIGWRELPIDAPMEAFAATLAAPFAGTPPGVAEENVQARIRGVLLMALSNKFGHLLLTTGNKSEYAVGYATLYGDMAGGFAPIKDVAKTRVYELARHRNVVEGRELIPEASITKAPSAELRPGQQDTDSLPPYDVLDAVLLRYVEQDRSLGQIVEEGFDADLVERIARMVDRAEYKRRQSAPGVKITEKAFGKDRRLPITQAWSGDPATPIGPPRAAGRS